MISPPDLTTPTSVVVIATGNGGMVWDNPRSFVVEAVRSLRETSGHRELEFVVVHPTTAPDATLTALVELPDIDLALVPLEGSPSAAAALNVGALHASGQVLLFLDERTHAKSDEMVGHLIAPLSRESIAMTGPKMVSSDGTISHAGLTVTDGVMEHPWRGDPDMLETSPDLFAARTVDGLDAACVAIGAASFREVGGWSEEIPDRFRALDLGLKVRREGHTLLWTADAATWSFGTDRARSGPSQWEIDFLTRRWGTTLSPQR